MNKVLLGLFVSPLIGLVFGWLAMRQALFMGQWMSHRATYFYRRAQWVTCMILGLSHGTNDAQKTMGILTMGLVAFGIIPQFQVPFWVIFASASAIAIGTAFGGWRLIKTMGAGFYRVRAVHAFTSQVASSVVILGAALLGSPVSTTQVISSTIVGAGAAQRVPMVRWGVANQILIAWILTIPATALMGALVFWILGQFNL